MTDAKRFAVEQWEAVQGAMCRCGGPRCEKHSGPALNGACNAILNRAGLTSEQANAISLEMLKERLASQPEPRRWCTKSHMGFYATKIHFEGECSEPVGGSMERIDPKITTLTCLRPDCCHPAQSHLAAYPWRCTENGCPCVGFRTGEFPPNLTAEHIRLAGEILGVEKRKGLQPSVYAEHIYLLPHIATAIAEAEERGHEGCFCQTEQIAAFDEAANLLQQAGFHVWGLRFAAHADAMRKKKGGR